MKRTTLLLIVLAFCISCSCNKTPQAQSGTDPQPMDAGSALSVSERNNDFTFRLFKHMDGEGKNLFYSPYSITSALSMAYAGARGNTAAEMANALVFAQPADEQHLGFKSLQQQFNALGQRGKAELNVANALFGAKKHEKLLIPEYLTMLRDNYASDLYSLDFGDAKGTAKYINSWVEKKTKDRIKDLVTEDHIRNSNDGLVLVNAIYFKGLWLKQFNPDLTKRDTFYTSSKKRDAEHSKPVNMMSLRSEFSYAQVPGYQILEMPYEEKELAMMFILPDEINDVKNSLNARILTEWQQKMNMREVQAFIPRFKFELTLEGLTDRLKDMGMKDAFSANIADFSGIRREDTGAGLYILDVIHKAFVEVKEEGTEAAAATAVVMATKAAVVPDQPPVVFRADRPFIYMILHKPTNTILFIGKYNTPPAE
jgi:serpin B